MTFRIGLVLLAFLAPVQFALAQGNQPERVSGVAVVEAFERYCLGQPFTVDEIASRLSGDTSLTQMEMPGDFNLKQAGESKAWGIEIDGRQFQLIILRRLGFKKSGIQCFLRTQELNGSLYPYLDPLRDRLKPLGIKGREIDIPAFYRASGRVADGRHVEIRFTARSGWPSASFTSYTTLSALHE